MVLPSFSSTAPSVHFMHPPSSLLKSTPSKLSANSAALSPPVSDFSLARPFNINTETYNNALNPAVPFTIAAVYMVTVLYGNRINKERGGKPWAFSKSTVFFSLVLTHNIFLAVYSGWTFLGMSNAIRQSWPGWRGDNGLAGVADALCKMQGPRGLGSAVTYNETLGSWGVTDRTIKLAGIIPDSTDVGRLWSEGLAFYGWLFYLSKFYEVLDTFIILAKGKQSSELQVFHHAGAMLCLWAGIRYMSPPIWMFVFVNSGLHTLMYTYYALSSLTVQVPRGLKRTLTFLQIAQIVFGASYALIHLFIAYDIPIEKPYLFAHNLSTALPSTASSISSAVSTAFTSATAAADIGSWLKKAALRAAGEEGLAENVRNYQGETFGIDAIHAADAEKAQEKIQYRLESQRVHCLDTSGEVFAILFNAIYLIPLGVLFVRFFRKAYMNRSHQEPPKPTLQDNVKASSKDAIKDIEKEIREAMAGTQGGTTEPPPELKAKLEKAKSDAKQAGHDLSDKAQDHAKDLSAKAQKGASDLNDKVKDAAGDLPDKAQKGAQDLGNKAKDTAGDLSAKAQKGTKVLGDKAKDAAGDLPAKAHKGAQDLGNKAKDAAGDLPAKAQKIYQDDLQALQDKMKAMGGEGAKKSKAATNDQGKENAKPKAESKSRDDSPSKNSKPRDKSPEKSAKPRDRSPTKIPTASRDAKKDQNDKKPKEDQGNKEPEEESKENHNGIDGDASAYELVPDVPRSEDEKRAEEEMQPKEE
ncbi:hypothetical protein P7C71_g4884, partial [Lecanoromycetidae sp. Uapishka_2]